jgi:nicotinamide mononucleotide adenylyltransferase
VVVPGQGHAERLYTGVTNIEGTSRRRSAEGAWRILRAVILAKRMDEPLLGTGDEMIMSPVRKNYDGNTGVRMVFRGIGRKWVKPPLMPNADYAYCHPRRSVLKGGSPPTFSQVVWLLIGERLPGIRACAWAVPEGETPSMAGPAM